MSILHLLNNPDRCTQLGPKMRKKRMGPLMRLIEKNHRLYGSVKIVDIGGRRRYWNLLPREFLSKHRVEILILNFESEVEAEDRGEPGFDYDVADGRDLRAYGDRTFDIAHSNSVVEHLQAWPDMIDFASELRRVAGDYFVQTPYYWFPVEPHFMKPGIHFLPKPLQVELVRRFDLGHFKRSSNLTDAIQKIESINLLDKKMFRELFPDAALAMERFCLLAKSIIGYRSVPRPSRDHGTRLRRVGEETAGKRPAFSRSAQEPAWP